VNETVAVSYPNLVTKLSPSDKKAILALAGKPLAEGEEVVVSGFAGSTATVEFGKKISEERAKVIQDFLAENGIESRIVGYGTTPVGEVLNKAQQKSIKNGLSDGRLNQGAVNDNRLAFVSAAVIQQNPNSSPSVNPESILSAD
jgi:hypothetical protein